MGEIERKEYNFSNVSEYLIISKLYDSGEALLLRATEYAVLFLANAIAFLMPFILY